MLWPTLLAVVATVYLVVRVVLTLQARDAPSTRPVVATPTPPPELTPGVAARLLRGTNNELGVVAEVLDLAVTGSWQLGVRDADGEAAWFVQRAQPYEPILVDVPLTVYRGVFSRGETALSRTFVPDERRRAAFSQAVVTAIDLAHRHGWVRRHHQRHLVLNLLGQGLLAAAIIIPASAAFAEHGSLVSPSGPEGLPQIIWGGSVGFFSQFAGIKPWTLTPEGRRLADELEGVRRYMTMPDAERRAQFGTPPVAVHERLLPYAVLFDLVPEWLEVVRADHTRAGSSPGWIAGAGDPAVEASVYASLAGVGGLRRLGA